MLLLMNATVAIPSGSRISMLQVNGVQSLKGSKTGAILFLVLFGSWKVRSSVVLLSLELSKQLSVSMCFSNICKGISTLLGLLPLPPP